MPESLSSLLAFEAELIQEAAEALPHQFSDCTYNLGYIRQAVYLCLTCRLPRGICSACSIACHTDHEQVELFPKRKFRCDCPTTSLPHTCTLHKQAEVENSDNKYGQNFRGVFCRCGRAYDAKTERETMIQCLACEDWFHESCLNLRERPPSRAPSPAAEVPTEENLSVEREDNIVEDNRSDASSSSLPPPLIKDSDYDTMFCRSCVVASPILRRWAGTKGALMVTRNKDHRPWKILDGETEFAEDLDVTVGSKRQGSSAEADGLPQAKKARVESFDSSISGYSVCLAPPIQPQAQEILSLVQSSPPNYTLGAGDVFFTEGWRERWCRCSSCQTAMHLQPFLLEDEEIYEPPEDPESGENLMLILIKTFSFVHSCRIAGLSLEELGLRALQNLPRDRALDGIRAFNEMRDDLMTYLRPFAQEGKVVNEEDVRSFFEAKMEAARLQRESESK
ncbi:hypothetical protein BD410DRAFT_791045 [Rickenella mellea]|uniref:UBR-type domain-containing protein n=1 Tax=Rickenella mellea TaxID=50990 RepID=A0A4Y7PYV3_9AGAM|nr:hypothetical protein BD410DRAFT_791045 [Rickenella mellea]